MRAKISLILAASAMLAGTPAFAASDYLLELEGVKGEASSKIEVASWSFGACNAGQCSTIKSPRDAASGLATGKRQPPAVSGSAPADRTVPTKGNWDLATGKGARTAGGVQVATGDVDGDGKADLAYAGTQEEVSSFTLSFNTSSPELAKMCTGKHFDKVTLSRGADSFVLTDSSVACSGTGPVTMVLSGGQMKHTKTGHVTLLK